MSDAQGSAETLQLLRRWHDGDRTALDTLVRENFAWVHGYVRRRLNDAMRQKVDSVDLVQNAMLQVLERGPRFQIADRDHFRALLARIVTNDIQDQHRWAYRQRRDQAREQPIARDSVLHLDRPMQSVTRPSENVDRDERKAWVRLAIELMDPEDRQILQQRQWESTAFAEIAAQLGVSEDAARMRHNRALKRLAEKVIELRNGSVARFLRDAGDLQ